MDYQTDFKDKTDKPIHIGDVVMHRLGKFAKTGGPSRHRVIMLGKKPRLIPEHSNDSLTSGILLENKLTEYLVVVDCPHMRG